MHALDEVAQHLLADVEVGDHAVLERPDRLDVTRRAADHALGFDADRERATVARVDRDDRRLVEHDAAPAHVDERVGSPQVDRHVAADDTRVPRLVHRRPPARLARLRHPTSLGAHAPPGTSHRRTQPLSVTIQEMTGKEERDLARRGLGSVAAVDEVLGHLDREVTAQRAGRRLARVRRAHERAHDLERFGAFDHHRDERAAGDERDEIVEERLAVVLGVVLLRRRLVELAQLERDELQAFALEAADAPRRRGRARRRRACRERACGHRAEA